MLPDRMVLSAYLDNEVPEEFRADIQHAIDNHPTVRAEYEELVELHQRLLDAPIPDVSESALRSWMRINHRTIAPARAAQSHRIVRVPLPAMAAAAVLFVAAVALLAWSLVRQSTPLTAEDYLAGGRDVDVTISVEGSQMESVLEWLASQNMLGVVNIQLPDEHQFSIVGEPVFVKPADYGGNIIP